MSALYSTLDDASLSAVSRLLSRVLRHEPELIVIRLDAAGWVRIDDLLDGIGKAARKERATKRLRRLPADPIFGQG